MAMWHDTPIEHGNNPLAWLLSAAFTDLSFFFSFFFFFSVSGRWEVSNWALCTTNRRSHRRRQTARTGNNVIFTDVQCKFCLLYVPLLLTYCFFFFSFFLAHRSIFWRSFAPSRRLYSHRTEMRSSRPCPTWEFCQRWKLYWWVWICLHFFLSSAMFPVLMCLTVCNCVKCQKILYSNFLWWCRGWIINVLFFFFFFF